jgi:hypothetical protein
MLQRISPALARAQSPATVAATVSLVSLIISRPVFAQATSPFLTGATALESNILAWLTPIAIILVMVLGGMAIANRVSWGWCVGAILGISQVSSTYGAWEAQTIVENCGNTLILRCSASEHGGTALFASRLIGERDVARRSTSRGRDGSGFPGSRGWRHSTNVSEQRVTESAVLASELEQLPDLTGYLKTASSTVWLKVRLQREPH